MQRIRAHTELPIAIGFGIARAEQVRQIAQFADGAIVGSAMVDTIAKAAKGEEPEQAATYLRSLKA